jgi:site-specific DNA recombinase
MIPATPKRTILYTRVSTDEQAEHGYSLQSQLEESRRYAAIHNLVVIAEISDDRSGSILERPGLDRLRDMIGQRKIDAVVVFSPDRLTRNLAHSLLLREEMSQAEVELHFCNRGKTENTPEARMTANIEAVFADYWREKIIESSRRGRLAKAASGKWPCDGHAAYGYCKIGLARDAELAIDEAEAAVIRRIFALYTGAGDGKPMPMSMIAATLTHECVTPPNRGSGAKHPGKIWHKGTIYKLLDRRAYIGEFTYGEHIIELPELAIVDDETFDAAQRRRSNGRARTVVQHRKYDFLLAGHITCTCGMSMSANAMQKGKYRYYSCNSKAIHSRITTCRERKVRAPEAEEMVWAWLKDLLCDEAALEQGIQELTNRSEQDLQETRVRLKTIEGLQAKAVARIERLATAFADEADEIVAAALRSQMQAAGREREALNAERELLQAKLVQEEFTENERDEIKRLAGEIGQKLSDPPFEQKRALLNLLDVQITLIHKDDKRWLNVNCGLTLKPTGQRTSTPLTLGTIVSEFSSTMTT